MNYEYDVSDHLIIMQAQNSTAQDSVLSPEHRSRTRIMVRSDHKATVHYQQKEHTEFSRPIICFVENLLHPAARCVFRASEYIENCHNKQSASGWCAKDLPTLLTGLRYNTIAATLLSASFLFDTDTVFHAWMQRRPGFFPGRGALDMCTS